MNDVTARRRAPTSRERFGGIVLEARSLIDGILAGARERERAITQQRFVLFGRGRSGSTLLVRMLDQHPDIACLGEILRFRVLFPDAYVDRCLGVLDAPTAGFKLLSYQMRQVMGLAPDSRFLLRLQARGYRIVYTRRGNLFRHALSNLYARRRQVFHQEARDDAPATTRITIDPQEVLHWMAGSEALNVYEQAALAGVEHLDLVYERDLETEAHQQATLTRVMAHLGVSAHPTRPTLATTTPRDVASFIENHEELRRAILQSRFADMLEDA